MSTVKQSKNQSKEQLSLKPVLPLHPSPATDQTPTPLLSLTFEELETFILKLGLKRYRVKQILSWIYQGQIRDFKQMTDLSILDRLLLSKKLTLPLLQIITHQKSEDGTEKFLFQLDDGNQIESVLIPEERRNTLCISSQAGCTLDCSFCLTAQGKLKRNLKSDEIINQILTIQNRLPEERRITNVVLMGMGEPLANLASVTKALEWMVSPFGFGFSPRRITVSTAGLVPQMRQFWQGPVPVNLSISLNATTDKTRDQLMPKTNRLYPLKELLSVCRMTTLPARRQITFEYVLLSGVNDSLEDAERLAKLTRGIQCKINLIPFNEYPSSPYRRPSEEMILQFQDHLHHAGRRTLIRKSRGRDIFAACGQLSTQGQK